jgi:uncharacterized protein YyaL (SSP411 family)
MLKEFSGIVSSSPTAYTQMLIALDLALGPGSEYVIAGDRGDEETGSIIRLLAGRFMPWSVTLLRPVGEGSGDIISLAPMLAGMTAIDGKPTVYICEDFRCAAPAVGMSELTKRISDVEKDHE